MGTGRRSLSWDLQEVRDSHEAGDGLRPGRPREGAENAKGCGS